MGSNSLGRQTSFIFLCLLAFAPQAWSQGSSIEPSRPLHLIYPPKSSLKDPVRIQVSRQKNVLRADFQVKTPLIYSKSHLDAGQYPYQYDVVEIFVSASARSDHYPYYEFELSPLNQTFQVQILEHGHFVNHVDMGITHWAHKVRGGWVGEIEIPLENLNWDGRDSSISGNAFAVLGKSPNRSYWSLSLPAEKKPNFHLPQYFQPLVEQTKTAK